MKVEVVRGRVDAALTDELVSFWRAHGVLKEAAARERAADAVCVLRADDGRVAGVNTVYKARLPAIGGRHFWMYRRFVEPEVGDEVHHELLAAAFDALEVEFEAHLEAGGDADDPMGLCQLVDDRRFARRNPAVVWPGSSMMYAGYLPDRRQVRIRYFTNAALWGRALVHPVHVPGDDITLRLFEAGDTALADKVVEMWMQHGRMPEAEAKRRAEEIFAVAFGPDGAVAGVCTLYLRRTLELQVGLWFYRAFVVPDRRAASVGSGLGTLTMEVLERRFASGEDTRGSGLVMILENQALRAINPTAVWQDTVFSLAYLGEDDRGHDIRLKWFPGATAPEPPP